MITFIFSVLAPLLAMLPIGLTVLALAPVMIFYKGLFITSLVGRELWALSAHKRFSYSMFLALICLVLTGTILFVSHPNTLGAGAYTLYWVFIPLLYILRNNLFARALLVTLTMHMLGSLRYLFLYQTTGLYWQALIAIVWYERLIKALIITTLGLVLSKVKITCYARRLI